MKNIRKAAFAFGVGFTVGKAVGGCVNSVTSGFWLETLKSLAKCGNTVAQDTCKRCNIEYEKQDEYKENSEKVKMGFHV